MNDAPAAGFPAELVARRELRTLFQTIGDDVSSRAEAERLMATLAGGRYLIDRATMRVMAIDASAAGPV